MNVRVKDDCAHCGAPFELTNYQQRYCSGECRRAARNRARAINKSKVREAARLVRPAPPPRVVEPVARGARDHGNQYVVPLESEGEVASVACKSDLHVGPRLLPLECFASWRREGLKCIDHRLRVASWCMDCLCAWLVSNGGADDHGQSPEADDAARVELYRRRNGDPVVVGGVDGTVLAARLIKGVA